MAQQLHPSGGKTLRRVFHKLPTFIKGTPFHLPLFVTCLLMHHLLASFPSLTPLSTLQPVFLGIASQINYLHLNPSLGDPSEGTPNLITFHTERTACSRA